MKAPYQPHWQMGIYAGLGVGQAVFFFFMGSGFAMLTYIASKKLHNVSSHGHTSVLTKMLRVAARTRSQELCTRQCRSSRLRCVAEYL